MAICRRVCDEAQNEWESVQRAAKPFDFDATPWELAPFLCVRNGFREEYQSRGGIEDALIDMAAQAFTMWQKWLGRLHTQQSFESMQIRANVSKTGEWQPPTVSTYEALEQSATMAERFHRTAWKTGGIIERDGGEVPCCKDAVI